MMRIREPAVAGVFYPGDAESLALEVATLMADAERAKAAGTPKAMIVPHAGYIYSGPVAATAYALLAGGKRKICRVVLLGPCHRVPVRGLALPGCDGFDTPLGRVAVDQQLASALSGLPQVITSPQAHAWEHSLEVQLPFLQAALDGFTLLPLVVGAASADEVAQVLERVWGGDETLIVVSSDLSHYLPYEQARHADAATAEAILQLHADIGHEQACGATPVVGLLRVAQRRGMQARLLDLRNSGDTAGDRGRVVGYGAFAFYPEAAHEG